MTLSPFTLPAATRLRGQPDPPGDMDNVLKCLFSMGGLGNVLNYGADPAGGSDSTAAFTTALATGLMIIPPGTYKIAGDLPATAPPTTVIGAGRSLVQLNYYGAADCLRIRGTGASSGFNAVTLQGFSIDGTHASAGASGLHMGDCFAPRIDDVSVQNFQGSGSKGAWFDNQYNFMEQLTGRIYARYNTQNVVFDNSANPNGGLGLGSFDRAIFDIFLDQAGVGDGVVFQNGAFAYDGRVGVYGNFSPGSSQYSAISLPATPSLSFTATNGNPCVFTAAGSYYGNGTLVTLAGGSLPAGFTARSYFVVNASGTSFELALTSGGTPVNSTSTGSGTVTGPQSAVFNSVFNVGVECAPTGPGSTFPYTINFGAASANLGAGNAIWDCTGIMDFGANAAFAHAQNFRFAFRFDGPVYGDADLWRATALGRAPFNIGSLANGATINTKFTGLTRVTTGSNVTGIILEGFNPDDWRQVTVLNVGTGSITFDVAGTSHVADGTADVIQPGSAATFHWSPNEGLWYRAV